MDFNELKTVTEAGTLLTTVAGGFFALFKYFNYKTRRDKIQAVGESFNAVVESLASDIEVERLAAAIRLRRFFDPKSELGVAGTPYAEEALNVIAAILRNQESGALQKLLADGLAYAPSLIRADLQRTNLQRAYLGFRSTGADKQGKTVDLSFADFYRADLSGASLKRANARGAVFYQARLHNTVLSGADLSDANFFEADLAGASFRGAILARATFKEARNLPQDLRAKLDANGVYPDEGKPFEPVSRAPGTTPVRVFLSKPGLLDHQEQQIVEFIREQLEAQGLTCETLERSEYPEIGVIAEVRRRMSGCAGAVILGFQRLKILEGVLRSDTLEDTRIKDQQLATPWNQLEAGLAAMLGLPMLLVRQPGVVGGIFDLKASDYQIHRWDLSKPLRSTAFQELFVTWCSAVREQARARA